MGKRIAESTGKYADIAVCLLMASWAYFALAPTLFP